MPPIIRHLVLFACIAGSVSAVQARSVALTVEGAPEPVAANIRAHLGLDDVSCDVTDLQLRARLRDADKQISSALRALGYYRGDWRLEKRRGGDCWSVVVSVKPGTPVTVTAVDVAVDGPAAGDDAFADFLKRLPVKKGDQLNHGAYSHIKDGLESLARNRGYFEGHFTEKLLKVDTRNNTAIIRLHYQSGPRYRFGEVHLPDDTLDESLLRRFLTFAPGEPYRTDKLIAFQKALSDSQYFDNVSVDQEKPDTESKTVAVEVGLKPKSRYLTTLGVGASTDTGPRVRAGIANRRVNRRGHTFDLSGQWSPVQSNATFQYQIPGQDPLRDRTVFGTGVQREETDTSKSTSYHLELSRISQLDSGWLQTLSLKYIREDYRIAGERDLSKLLVPGIHWDRSEANDPRYPTLGWRVGATLRGAVEGVLSDTDFSQAQVDAKVIFPLLGGRVLTRGTAGGTVVGDFSALPASLRFFAGGDNSVRGFAYKSLGPMDQNGEVVGGKYLLTGSVEYDYPILQHYSAAVFYDIGNAFDTHRVKLYRSVGFGVRWRSPIGPIRIDFAFPLDKGDFRLHLSMGPDL